MAQRTARTYDAVAKSLHWLTLALLITQFTFAWTMPHIGRTVPSSILIDCHVWFGVTILFVTAIRLVWRLTHAEPVPEEGIPPWQVATARLIHWLLYVLIFTIPILGWMNASWREMRVTFFGILDLPKLLATRMPGWDWTGDLHALLADRNPFLRAEFAGICLASA